MFAFKLIASLSLFCLVYGQDYYVHGKYGAVGNGVADDTIAIRNALAAANHSNGGRVIFEAGYTFLTGPLVLTKNVILLVQGEILGSTNYSLYVGSSTTNYLPLISSKYANNITITGGGVIDGQGWYWWGCSLNDNSQPPCLNKNRPTLVLLQVGTNININNVTFQNSPMFNVYLDGVNGAHIHHVNILAPGSHDPNNPSHNTDGISVSNSQNVLFEFSYISVGDVAIMAGSAWQQTSNVTFRYLNIGTSHGLSIGGFTSAGVKNVTFQNITMNGNLVGDHIETGPLIISMPGIGGVVEDITFTNITLYNVYTCISADMNFTWSGYNATSKVPQFKNINFNNVVCQNSTYGWNLNGLNNNPIQLNINNIQLTNIAKPTKCSNAYGTCDSNTVKPSCPVNTSGCVASG